MNGVSENKESKISQKKAAVTGTRTTDFLITGRTLSLRGNHTMPNLQTRHRLRYHCQSFYDSDMLYIYLVPLSGDSIIRMSL